MQYFIITDEVEYIPKSKYLKNCSLVSGCTRSSSKALADSVAWLCSPFIVMKQGNFGLRGSDLIVCFVTIFNINSISTSHLKKDVQQAY